MGDQVTVLTSAGIRQAGDQVTVDLVTKLPWITLRFGRLSTGNPRDQVIVTVRDQVTVTPKRQINELFPLKRTPFHRLEL
jgi:hypothetical protein